MFYYVAYILLSNMIKYSYMDTYFPYTLKHGYFYNLDPDLGPGPWTLDPKNLDPEKPHLL